METKKTPHILNIALDGGVWTLPRSEALPSSKEPPATICPRTGLECGEVRIS
jgi:hypothetical protein